MEKHFVTFYSPGTFVAETTEKPIDSWNVEQAKAMAEDYWRTIAEHQEKEVERLRGLVAKYEAEMATCESCIEALSGADQPSDDSVLEPGEEWWMDVAGVPVALSEWEPGARKRRASDPTVAGVCPTCGQWVNSFCSDAWHPRTADKSSV